MKSFICVLFALLALVTPVRAITWPVVTRVVALSTSSAASVAAPAIVTTAGNHLVVGFTYQGAGTPTVTNTAGDTWAQVGSEASEGTNKARLYSAHNITGNAADVVTVSFSANSAFTSVSVFQLVMPGTASPVHGSNQANGTGTAISSGDVTISRDVALISHGIGNGATIRPTNGNLLLSTAIGVNTNTQFLVSTFRTASSTQAVTLTQTSATWAIVAGAFSIPSPTASYAY